MIWSREPIYVRYGHVIPWESKMVDDDGDTQADFSISI